jgi:hypothetical protein
MALLILGCSGEARIAPSSLTFPDATVGLPSTKELVVTNAAQSGDLTLQSTEIAGPDAKMFGDRFKDGVPVVLKPGESTTLKVVFLPSAPGPRSATLFMSHSGSNSPAKVTLSGTAGPGAGVQAPGFGKSALAGASLTRPTALQFGPDGRLYVAQMDGTIKALTVERQAPQRYVATATETLSQVRAIDNHDDNGERNTSVTTRQVTGLLVTGSAASPQVYVASSDPRIGAGGFGVDLNLDTNSGVLSRLTKTGGSWQRTDLVRGLPRSEENHAGNGLALDPATGKLLIAYGGNTNKGAPSHNFALLPEVALSGAVLSVDLAAIGGSTYDLPTVDDESRPGHPDAGDPFGGNDGNNQARLVPGGPVQVYAPGFRNPYDLLVSRSGQIYTIDNGGNAGWGGAPAPDGASGTCVDDPVEPSDTDLDSLLRISGPGFYGGHPNPTRANRDNTFNAGDPQSPVASANPEECDYRNEAERGALTTFPFSTNGLDEYTASNFGGAMKGDILAASHDDAIYRVRLTADGTAVTSNDVLFSSVDLPLDVTALGDADPYPGTIWAASFIGDEVVVFEPEDFPCSGADNPNVDEDDDGFDNADEIDNGTNPCSSADVPPDADSDGTSDRNDADDDNDARPDNSDPFAVDAANGRDTPLPVRFTWDNDAPAAGGLLRLGFTGLMTNGSADYLELFDPSEMTAGGAAGVVTVDEVPDGDALGSANTQEYGFQHGIDVTDQSGPFVVHTSLPAPFSGTSPSGGESYGVFVGTGTQDDYVKLAVAANDGAGGLALVTEKGGAPATTTEPGPQWPGPSHVDLYLRVDPGAGTVRASYSIEGAAPIDLGAPQAVPKSWFTGPTGLAVGIVSTSTGPAPAFPATWDLLEVKPAPTGTPGSTAVEVGSPGLNSSTFNAGSFRVTNQSPAGQQIAGLRLDLSSSLLPDLVFDPQGTAGDALGKGFVVDSGAGLGTIDHTFTGSHDGGYDVLNATFTDFGPGETLTFSADVDPTSLKGAFPPGPNEAGSVSGLELSGAAVTVAYEDGTSESGRLYRVPGSLGQSRVALDAVGRPRPSVAVLGTPDTPAAVADAAQTIRVSGRAGSSVRLLAVEGGLFTEAVPDGGFDLDPFEANSVIGVAEHSATIGAGGSVDIPVTLSSTAAEGGNNRFMAVIAAAGGTGATSSVVLQLEPPGG